MKKVVLTSLACVLAVALGVLLFQVGLVAALLVSGLGSFSFSLFWAVAGLRFVLVVVLAVGLVAALVLNRGSGRFLRILPLALLVVAAATYFAVLAAVPAADTEARLNDWGLLAGTPNSNFHHDYAKNEHKRAEYPPIDVVNNELGYRDEAVPPAEDGRLGVWLVGDSYVWGDGIPKNEQTLTALVRRELESARPGTFRVATACHPGLGYYGYRRSVEEILARRKPSVIVVGSLGCNDGNPVDAQRLGEMLPTAPLLRNVVLASKVLQRMHESFQNHFTRPRTNGVAVRESQKELDEMASLAEKSGARLVIIEFAGPRCPPEWDLSYPEGAELIELPEDLRCPWDRANEYWYENDPHPKPPLVEEVARRVSERVLAGARL